MAIGKPPIMSSQLPDNLSIEKYGVSKENSFCMRLAKMNDSRLSRQRIFPDGFDSSER
jgi:hypothetical protein